jgi:subtilisin family serine protease
MPYSIPVGRHTSRSAWLTAAASVALTLIACQDAAAPISSAVGSESAETSQNPQTAATAIADEYIVIFNTDVGDVDASALALEKAHGASRKFTYKSAFKGFSAHMSADAAAAMMNDPRVLSVELDQVVSLAGTQTGAPWGLDRIDQAGLTGDGLFIYPNTGAGVNVYILDSGIRRTHTQFGGRVVPAYSVLNDGYSPDGCYTHGTHVAGVVGGSTWGVAKGATLHSVRVTDCAGLVTTSNLIAGVEWVTANRVRPAVANMSLSSIASSALNLAVTNSINSGVTYVVSGGNANGDACNYSPANLPAAIAVGAIGGLDARANYSNLGPCIDIYAPGTQIYSATNTDDSSYALDSGTSQASAFVAGAAALYLASNPTASPADVTQALLSGATAGVVSGLTADTPNRLLRVVGGSGGSTPPPPPPPPPGNTAPTAGITSSCQKATCSLDGSSSRDDAGVVSYSWNFGDGTTATSTTPLIKHSYTTKGSYSVTVTLTVTDAAGLTGSAQKTLNIRNNGR